MISVIVPIYNVEDYLRKCLDSLAAQTFPSVEFILIDDGSTDGSRRIADEYANDSRFRIFHTENHGLSAARNYGIEKSNGEWLMFVDGDDWVDPNFCELPYATAYREKADIVIFRARSIIKGRVSEDDTEICTGLISADVAIDCGGNAAWNKLYKRELFGLIRYPEGMVFEDVATTYKLVFQAERIVAISDFLYNHYLDRKKSITNTISSRNAHDRFVAICQRNDFLIKRGYPKEKLMKLKLNAAILLLASRCTHDDPYYQKAKAIVDSTRGIPTTLSWKKKCALILWKTSRSLFYFVCELTGRMRV